MANRRFNQEEREDINLRLQRGEPVEAIAADYKCHRVTLERWLAREGYVIEQVEVKIIRRLRHVAAEAPGLAAASAT